MQQNSKIFKKIVDGYQAFREKYVYGATSTMDDLARDGQQPKIMVVACCDARVDPAVILQCDPGDLFVVRNVANIVPPYEKDEKHHGTSAALEFGVNFLKVEHLILLGHSQCGGIQTLLDSNKINSDDFITNWVSILKTPNVKFNNADDCAKLSLQKSYENCMTFPWIAKKVEQQELMVHLWFFDIKMGQIFKYNDIEETYQPL